jgi:hypothetical protein
VIKLSYNINTLPARLYFLFSIIKMSTTSDPKRPNAVVPYTPPVKHIDEIDPDLYGTFSLILSKFI